MIYHTGDDISNKVGRDGEVIKLFGEVQFDKIDSKYPGQGVAHHIWLSSTTGFDEWTVAHELGHSLDGIYGGKLSEGLEEFTGGYTLSGSINFGGPACIDTTAPGCNRVLYFYGGVPPKGSDWNFNRLEDFAESFAALEPVCKIRKEENGSNRNHGREVDSPFFIASGNPTKLFETIDEAFNNVSFAIVLFVERTSAALITATSNGTTNVLAMEIPSKGNTGIAFIGNQTLRA